LLTRPLSLTSGLRSGHESPTGLPGAQRRGDGFQSGKLQWRESSLNGSELDECSGKKARYSISSAGEVIIKPLGGFKTRNAAYASAAGPIQRHLRTMAREPVGPKGRIEIGRRSKEWCGRKRHRTLTPRGAEPRIWCVYQFHQRRQSRLSNNQPPRPERWRFGKWGGRWVSKTPRHQESQSCVYQAELRTTMLLTVLLITSYPRCWLFQSIQPPSGDCGVRPGETPEPAATPCLRMNNGSMASVSPAGATAPMHRSAPLE